MRALELRDGSQVGEARRAAVAMAEAHGFGPEDAGRVAVVATELATNLLKHGGGGMMLLGGYDDPTGSGIECLALDKGAGMADVASCMRDGHSTAGSPGNGLGAVARGAHVFDVYSASGMGTAVLARMRTGRPDPGNPDARPGHGAVSVPMRGEEACGDSWCEATGSDDTTLMVADGLGHGPLAAEASGMAVRIFGKAPAGRPSDILAAMHAALRPTRGAAVAIAHIDRQAGEIRFAGVGNIAATIVAGDGSMRRMVSHNGTVGLIARQMRGFAYPLADAALVVLASDGLGTNWRLGAYPGLAALHPTLIAGVLYRDFHRARDDVTVLVCRVGGA